MKKNNEKQLIEVNNYIADLKEYSKKYDGIRSLERDKFWEAVRGMVKTVIKTHENRIDSLLRQKSIEHPGNILAEVKFYKGGIEALQELISQVDNVDDHSANLLALIKEQEALSNEIKSNIELQGDHNGK
jgi:hypothetical protein